jgi:hypothetical protein
LTRHELKEQLAHDHFTDAISDIVSYTVSNRTLVIRLIVAVVILAALGSSLYWYFAHQAAARQRDLQSAFDVAETPVGPSAPNVTTFPSEQAKIAAELKAFASVAAKDAHTREGWIAQYEVGALKAQQGDDKGAEADLSAVAGSGSEVAPLARIALASLYAGENRIAEARVLLENLVNHPSALVSKAQAQILLAQLEMKGNPQQAKRILQSLKTPNERPAVARAVSQLESQSNP